MWFESVFEPKPCSELQPWELPHLPEKNVSDIAEKIVEYYGEVSLCISVFRAILVICNIKNTGGMIIKPWCALEANLIAEVMDYFKAGEAENKDVLGRMRTGPGGHYLFLRSSTTPDASQDEMVPIIGTTVTIRQEIVFKDKELMILSRRQMF